MNKYLIIAIVCWQTSGLFAQDSYLTTVQRLAATRFSSKEIVDEYLKVDTASKHFKQYRYRIVVEDFYRRNEEKGVFFKLKTVPAKYFVTTYSRLGKIQIVYTLKLYPFGDYNRLIHELWAYTFSGTPKPIDSLLVDCYVTDEGSTEIHTEVNQNSFVLEMVTKSHDENLKSTVEKKKAGFVLDTVNGRFSPKEGEGPFFSNKYWPQLLQSAQEALEFNGATNIGKLTLYGKATGLLNEDPYLDNVTVYQTSRSLGYLFVTGTDKGRGITQLEQDISFNLEKSIYVLEKLRINNRRLCFRFRKKGDLKVVNFEYAYNSKNESLWMLVKLELEDLSTKQKTPVDIKPNCKDLSCGQRYVRSLLE